MSTKEGIKLASFLFTKEYPMPCSSDALSLFDVKQGLHASILLARGSLSCSGLCKSDPVCTDAFLWSVFTCLLHGRTENASFEVPQAHVRFACHKLHALIGACIPLLQILCSMYASKHYSLSRLPTNRPLVQENLQCFPMGTKAFVNCYDYCYANNRQW